RVGAVVFGGFAGQRAKHAGILKRAVVGRPRRNNKCALAGQSRSNAGGLSIQAHRGSSRVRSCCRRSKCISVGPPVVITEDAEPRTWRKYAVVFKRAKAYSRDVSQGEEKGLVP